VVAEIVHEMRTPLTSISGYADLIRKPGTTLPECQQFAGIIRDEAERLSKLAGDYLDLARLESGRAPLAQDPVDMSTVIRMAISVIIPQADAKQIGLEADVPAVLPAIVGDGQRLHQAMLNLIGNAVKHCRPGDNVTVSASIERDRLVIAVADTGPGIPAEALPHLFERFYRAPGAQRGTGTGLGLTITRQIVEVHEGMIDVSSVKGAGTTLTVSFPLADDVV
jgi:signal transduction histidine kinase